MLSKINNLRKAVVAPIIHYKAMADKKDSQQSVLPLAQLAKKVIEKEKELLFTPDCPKAKRVDELKKMLLKEIEDQIRAVEET